MIHVWCRCINQHVLKSTKKHFASESYLAVWCWEFAAAHLPILYSQSASGMTSCSLQAYCLSSVFIHSSALHWFWAAAPYTAREKLSHNIHCRYESLSFFKGAAQRNHLEVSAGKGSFVSLQSSMHFGAIIHRCFFFLCGLGISDSWLCIHWCSFVVIAQIFVQFIPSSTSQFLFLILHFICIDVLLPLENAACCLIVALKKQQQEHRTECVQRPIAHHQHIF